MYIISWFKMSGILSALRLSILAQTNVKELTSPVGVCVGSVEGDADGPLLGVCEGDRLGLVVGCKLNGVK